MIKGIDRGRIRDVFDEDIEKAVVIVVNKERTLAVLTVIREPDVVSADILPSPVSMTFEEQVTRRRISSALEGRFGNEDVEVAIAVIVSDRNALPGPGVRHLLDDT